MATRTTSFVIRFASPFLLTRIDAPQPPGEFRIEQDEEMIEGVSRPARRRVATFIHLPATVSQSLTGQLFRVDPAEFDAALEKDREHA